MMYPQDPLLYFHRVGRTARAGDTGKAFTLVSGDEQSDFERILSLSKAPHQPAEEAGRGAQLLRPREDHHHGAPGFEIWQRRRRTAAEGMVDTWRV